MSRTLSRFRVSVSRTVTTNGWIEVEAEDASEAFAKIEDMTGERIEDSAEWGSCGDIDAYDVHDYIEKVYEPSVSDGLWN